ncbi:MAG TPA: bacillithiol biosynthesis BshC [Planctomycetota bacterium]|nr:bacillithiol biosynthesis BshC [Planctomycetota bacterium]
MTAARQTVPWDVVVTDPLALEAHDRIARENAARPLLARAADLARSLDESLLDRKELADRLAAASEASGAPPASRAAARRLANVGAVAVVTGQQPGFLGGPLLSFLKAAHAVTFAQALERASGVPAVALFWNHSDDHDLDETRTTALVDARGQVRRITLDLGRGRPFLSDVIVPSSADASWERVVDCLPSGPDLERVRATFRPRAGERFASETTRVLLALLGDRGLVVFEPRDLRPLLSRALARVLRDAPAGLGRLRALGERMRAEKRTPPLDLEDPPLVFARTDRGRERARFDGGAFRIPDGSAVSPSELADLVEREPDRFTAGVASRPAVEALALPTVATVKGPAELAYAPSAHCFLADRPAPIAVPRFSATLLDRDLDRILAASRRSPAEVLRGETVSRDGAPHAGERELERLEDEVRRRLGALAPSLRDLDSNLERPAAKTLATATRALATLRAKLARSIASHGASDDERRLAAALRPLGKPQERIVPAAPFLCAAWDRRVAAILEAIEPVPAGHAFVHLPDAP